MAWSTAARRSGLTLGEPRRTRETRDLETPARSATSRMVGRGAGCSPLTCIRASVVTVGTIYRTSLAHAPGPGGEPTRWNRESGAEALTGAADGGILWLLERSTKFQLCPI